MTVEELRLQKEKVRVYSLARELNIESKDLVDLCRQDGIDVKNQLSSLDPDQVERVKMLVKKGGGASASVAVAAPSPKPSAIPSLPTPVPVLSTRPKREAEVKPAPAKPIAETPAAPAAAAPATAVPPTASPTTPRPQEAPPAAAAKAPEVPTMTPRPPETPAVKPAEPSPKAPPVLGGRVPDLGGQPRDVAARLARPKPRPSLSHPGLAAPPPLKPKPANKDLRKPQQPITQKPIARLPEALTGAPVNIKDLLGKTPPVGEVPVGEFEEEEGEAGKGKARPGGVAGRNERHLKRAERSKLLKKGRGEGESKSTRVLLEEDDRPHRIRGLKAHLKVKKKEGPKARIGKVPVLMPITVRSLSEAVGLKSGDLLFRLRDHGAPPTININSIVDPIMAEVIAHDVGCEIDIKKPLDVEEKLLGTQGEADTAENLQPRAPIVTIMGHVDHGKTSLLDKIRKSNVVATEAGGITQVIRAWRVEHGGRPITFLDTPGHEAFTKMRARGAQVTDIAVIVVAADDGVMPQTEEAINHAKAASVSLVIAINKIDMPSANVDKTRRQLYNLSVLPDNMGGDTPFVETSAATGKGIDELLDQLSVVAELKELKANPDKPARGTCLEAMLDEGEGVLATLLVQEGTLHAGDVILCGATYGRVRAMYSDMGKPLDAAGPSVPVRIAGLDAIPNADDAFHVIPDLALAREIAEKRRERMQEAAMFKRAPVRLESLGDAKIAELKVILKADFRGSIEAIRKEIEKYHHDEVRVRILHAAIGGITESDVQLALTSPEDTIIVGFNVVPDDRALQLAEEKAVQIREYDIIYNLTEDIRSALEGKLKPREEVIHLGRAVVRKTFKISRVGLIAGCFVTQGIIERSAKVRVIRDGVVIYPPSDRTASLESLKRIKEDAREVREGFECGLKIAGYDDIKVGDVIEAYRVEQVQRTL